MLIANRCEIISINFVSIEVVSITSALWGSDEIKRKIYKLTLRNFVSYTSIFLIKKHGDLNPSC